MQLFAGRKLVIATNHGKEQVIAPLLEEALGVTCMLANGFDTDELGTFSGEVERKYDPQTTARLKCTRALETSGCDLVVSSEGSFGPHPGIPFINADDELVMLMDQANHLVVTGQELSLNTNFDGTYVRNLNELQAFAKKNLFPTHALILKDREKGFERLVKGIDDWKTLMNVFESLMVSGKEVFVETDMRALYNPTRMEVIRKATENLLINLKSCCDQCGTPGFTVKEIIRGLPCEWCGEPTGSVKTLLYICSRCGYRKESGNEKKLKEDPMYCDHCNP